MHIDIPPPHSPPQVDTPCGILPPGEACEVTVTLAAVAAQSLRRSLALHVENGPTRYVAARAEVVERRACLSLSAMQLGSHFGMRETC